MKKKTTKAQRPSADIRKARLQEIGTAVKDAMGAFSKKQTVDWGKGSITAQNALDEAMYGYVEGKVSRLEVKAAYQRWAQECVNEI